MIKFIMFHKTIMKKIKIIVLAAFVLSSCSKDIDELTPKMKDTTSSSQQVKDNESLTKQKPKEVMANSKSESNLPSDVNEMITKSVEIAISSTSGSLHPFAQQFLSNAVNENIISPEEEKAFSSILSKLNLSNPNSISDAQGILISLKPTTVTGKIIVDNLQDILIQNEEPVGDASKGNKKKLIVKLARAVGAIFGAIGGAIDAIANGTNVGKGARNGAQNGADFAEVIVCRGLGCF
jgi:hypothetical protein